MSWEVQMAWRGELEKFRTAELKAGQQAVTTIIRRRITALKTNLRSQVKKALGSKDSTRLQNTIRDQTYPKRGSSLNAAGLVWSKALYKRPGGLVDIITVLDEGTTIEAKKGTFVAFPINERIKGRGVKNDPVSKPPSSFPKGTFDFIPAKDGNALLVFRISREPAYYLMRQITLRPKIDVDKSYQKAIRDLDGEIVREWEKRDLKTQQRFNIEIR